MSYILAVNLTMFSDLSMPGGAVFTSTALAAIIGCVSMAFIGLSSAGIVVNNESTLVALGDITSGVHLHHHHATHLLYLKRQCS